MFNLGERVHDEEAGEERSSVKPSPLPSFCYIMHLTDLLTLDAEQAGLTSADHSEIYDDQDTAGENDVPMRRSPIMLLGEWELLQFVLVAHTCDML
jgi:hypothetical protein